MKTLGLLMEFCSLWSHHGRSWRTRRVVPARRCRCGSKAPVANPLWKNARNHPCDISIYVGASYIYIYIYIYLSISIYIYIYIWIYIYIYTYTYTNFEDGTKDREDEHLSRYLFVSSLIASSKVLRRFAGRSWTGTFGGWKSDVHFWWCIICVSHV